MRKQGCGGSCAIDGWRLSSFAGRSLSKITSSISSALKNVSPSKIDGSQHATSPTDPARDRFLIAQRFEIARYWNNDVLQRSTAVLEDIFARLTREL
jgi:very-short-patch-repair endonuclease